MAGPGLGGSQGLHSFEDTWMLMQLEAGGLTSASSPTQGRGLNGRMGPISVNIPFLCSLHQLERWGQAAFDRSSSRLSPGLKVSRDPNVPVASRIAHTAKDFIPKCPIAPVRPAQVSKGWAEHLPLASHLSSGNSGSWNFFKLPSAGTGLRAFAQALSSLLFAQICQISPLRENLVDHSP